MKSGEPTAHPKAPDRDFITTLIQLPQLTGLTPLMALAQFTFACLAMGGFMYHPSLTIDEELALFSNFEISLQGRFTLEIMRRLFLPPAVLPLAPYVFLGAAYIVSFTTILYIHGLRHSWKTQIGFLVFILFPINWLMQEWSGLAAGLGIGLICTSLAALLTMEAMQSSRPRSNRILLSVFAVVLLVFSIATFQSQITLYLAIGTGVTLYSKPGSIARQVSTRFSSLIPWFLHALTALISYILTTKIFLLITKQTLQHVNTYFKSPYFMLRTDPVKYLSGNLEQFLRTYLTPGWFYGIPLSALSFLVAGSILLYFYCAQQRFQQSQALSLKRGLPAVMGWLLLLALPLSLNIISTPNRIPMRSLFAIPYVAWFVTMIWLELTERIKRTNLLQIGTIAACILIFQSLTGISHYYAARALSQRSDQLVASSIASVMATSPNQSQSVTQILTKGAIPRENPYRTAWYSTAGHSFFNWDNGNTIRIAGWLRANGLPKLEPIPKTQTINYKNDFSQMKAWPQPGSIRVVGKILLVKLSDSD